MNVEHKQKLSTSRLVKDRQGVIAIGADGRFDAPGARLAVRGFCNVDALDEVVAVPIDDLPRVTCEVLTALRKINAH
jgi:hypothetical protein